MVRVSRVSIRVRVRVIVRVRLMVWVRGKCPKGEMSRGK